MHTAMIVLSGGFDSVALLHWVMERHKNVRAVSFDYGQPHRDAELCAAQEVAERRLGVGRWERLRLTGLGSLDVEPGMTAPGVARAVVPGRNLIFLSHAAARAAHWFEGRTAFVYYGANADDAEGFADCRIAFVRSVSEAVKLAHFGTCELEVRAPWVELPYTKLQIARWIATRGPEVLEDVRRSVSCYRGTRCGVCDACSRRTAAFTAAKLEDGTAGAPVMKGGDPQRV